jgi:hypothetical protein
VSYRDTKLLPPCKRYAKRPTDVPYSTRLYNVLHRSPHPADYSRVLYIAYEGHSLRQQAWIANDETHPLLLRELTNLERLEFRRLSWRWLGWTSRSRYM